MIEERVKNAKKPRINVMFAVEILVAFFNDMAKQI